MITKLDEFKKLHENVLKKIINFFKHPCKKCGTEMQEEMLTTSETYYRCPKCDKTEKITNEKVARENDNERDNLEELLYVGDFEI